MNKINLFLDDIRMPEEVGNYFYPVDDRVLYRKLDWKIVRNYKEFCEFIKQNGIPDLVSFDHDLADIHYDPSTWTESFKYEEETGLDCAKWLANYCLDKNEHFPEYKVHSMNPIGRENIISFLTNFKKHGHQLNAE
jgi:hypothetical protein